MGLLLVLFVQDCVDSRRGSHGLLGLPTVHPWRDRTGKLELAEHEGLRPATQCGTRTLLCVWRNCHRCSYNFEACRKRASSSSQEGEGYLMTTQEVEVNSKRPRYCVSCRGRSPRWLPASFVRLPLILDTPPWF